MIHHKPRTWRGFSLGEKKPAPTEVEAGYC